MKSILPNSTIGIIGGGQLGRMIAIAAKYMGYKTVVLDPVPENPCESVCNLSLIADYDDKEAHIKLGKECDVVTYEFENISASAIQESVEHNAFYLPQGHRPLAICQHRKKEKDSVIECGYKVAPYSLVHTIKDLEEFGKAHTFPFLVKTCMLGYDGKGQIKIMGEEGFKRADALITQQECIAEKIISFQKELSVVVFRSTNGEIATLDTCENIHYKGILQQTIAPARITQEQNIKVQNIAKHIIEQLNFFGTLAIEMFLFEEDIYINEMAPRPHNSGHFSIEGASYSQFEQHIRTLCGLPLGENKSYGTSWMVNILGEHFDKSIEFLQSKKNLLNTYFHFYEKKEVKQGRKMGHVTFVQVPNESMQSLEERVNIFLQKVIFK